MTARLCTVLLAISLTSTVSYLIVSEPDTAHVKQSLLVVALNASRGGFVSTGVESARASTLLPH